MPLVRQRPLGGAARRGVVGLSPADDLVRPALEAALQVAVAGQLQTPPLDVPRGLRPFLKFQRLPERALGPVRRAIDDDEVFRQRIIAVATEEQLGRAAWLFVSRPPGWADELERLRTGVVRARAEADEERASAHALRRVAELEEALRRVESARDVAAGELAELRARLAEERRLRHLAETEAGRLRQRVTHLEDAQRRAEEVAAEQVARAAALEQLVDDGRRRAAALESAGEATARAAPIPFDVGALEATVASAARAVAEASAALEHVQIDLASVAAQQRRRPPVERRAASRRPDGGGRAESDRRPVDLPPAVFDDSDEAAAFLVRVRGVTVLVDGYNVTKLARPELTLGEQRQWLVDAASGLAARCGTDVQLVFDGAGETASIPADSHRRHGVQTRFSADGVEADDVLIDLVGLLPASRPVVVATNDRRVQHACRAAGANVVSSDQFLATLGVTPRR